MTRGTSFARGLNTGFGTGVQLHRDSREETMRRDILKKQMEDAEADREIRRRGLKLQEEGQLHALDERQQRHHMEAIRREIEAKEKADPTNPENRYAQARAALAEAQADALNKSANEEPDDPLTRQAKGVQRFAQLYAGAQLEFEQAQQSGDPQRVLTAQLTMQGLQQLQQSLMKDQTSVDPLVEIEVPSEDGMGKMRLKVPQSQWGPQHPYYRLFAPQGGGAPAPAAGQGGPQQIFSRAEYERLRPNTPFIWNGKPGMKP